MKAAASCPPPQISAGSGRKCFPPGGPDIEAENLLCSVAAEASVLVAAGLGEECSEICAGWSHSLQGRSCHTENCIQETEIGPGSGLGSGYHEPSMAMGRGKCI